MWRRSCQTDTGVLFAIPHHQQHAICPWRGACSTVFAWSVYFREGSLPKGYFLGNLNAWEVCDTMLLSAKNTLPCPVSVQVLALYRDMSANRSHWPWSAAARVLRQFIAVHFNAFIKWVYHQSSGRVVRRDPTAGRTSCLNLRCRIVGDERGEILDHRGTVTVKQTEVQAFIDN